MYRAWVILSFLYLAVLGGAAHAQEATSVTIELRMRSAKEAVLPGEPCILLLEFTNDGDDALQVDMGADGIEAYVFSVTNAAGLYVINRLRIPHPSGSYSSWRLPLQPHASARQGVVLNRFLPAILPEGEYTVTCYVQTLDAEVRPATCTLHVLAPNDAALSGALWEVARAVHDGRKPVDMSGWDPSGFWVMQLAYSRSPLAVEPLSSFLNQNGFMPFIADSLTRGLERIGTLDAAKELVVLAEMAPTTVSRSLLRVEQEGAFRSLERLKKVSKDPEVIRLCEEKTKGRPVEPFPLATPADTTTGTSHLMSPKRRR